MTPNDIMACVANAFAVLATEITPLLPLTAGRMTLLAAAAAAGADIAALKRLAGAVRAWRRSTVVLPAGRFENLSRGKGWARKGRGPSAVWGEKVEGGYEVGPGRWTVGSNDGFARKEQTEWTVEHVRVADETWTVAS